MIGAKIEDLKIQWNSRAILTPAESFVKRLLDRFGAYCMKAQRNSIKAASSRRQKSQPGQAPVYHNVALLGGAKGYKGTIFYASDYRDKSVSIGPVLLNGTAGGAGGQRVPEVLERGGMAIVLSGRGRDRKRRPIQVAARPSAQPAFERSIKKKLPELIAGGILGG